MVNSVANSRAQEQDNDVELEFMRAALVRMKTPKFHLSYWCEDRTSRSLLFFEVLISFAQSLGNSPIGGKPVLA